MPGSRGYVPADLHLQPNIDRVSASSSRRGRSQEPSQASASGSRSAPRASAQIKPPPYSSPKQNPDRAGNPLPRCTRNVGWARRMLSARRIKDIAPNLFSSLLPLPSAAVLPSFRLRLRTLADRAPESLPNNSRSIPKRPENDNMYFAVASRRL